MKVILPPGSILDPTETAAVVGGNVLTSQRVVDVVLKAFEVCAASQVSHMICLIDKKKNTIIVTGIPFGNFERALLKDITILCRAVPTILNS